MGDEGKPEKGIHKQKGQGMSVKVYLVLRRHNVPDDSQADERIIDQKLTRSAAEEVQKLNPGSYIHKLFVTK